VGAQVAALGEVLAEQAIGVLVRRPLRRLAFSQKYTALADEPQLSGANESEPLPSFLSHLRVSAT
jgi:hypothetical protein